MSGHANADELGVSGHAFPADERAGQRDADRRRAAKLRQRREQAGEVRIQAWVPRKRAAYARDILRAAAAGANALPPDPAQQVELDAARAEAAAIRAELEEIRVISDQQAEQVEHTRSVAVAALARADVAERDREEATRELAAVQAEAETTQQRERIAQEAIAALRGELESIKSRGGWRSILLRLAGV